MEAAVSSSLGAMGPLLRKLDLLLAPEYRLRKSLRDGIELLKEDLQEISSALVELSTLETPTQRAKCWMEEARELSYLIEDFVDDMMRTRSDADSKRRSVFRHRVGRVKIAQLPELPRRSTRITRITQLRALLQQASERYERYQLDACCSSSSLMITVHGRAPTLYGDSANLFGIEDSRIKLIEMLTVEAEQRLKVVSIVGPAGVGKTTLAKEIFHELGGQFELRAFVRASRKLDMRRLLGSILSQFLKLPSVSGSVQTLIDNIQEQLKDKRCFIVIDDLWEETSWDVVSAAFLESNNCSRIVATSEKMNVALKCSGYMPDNILKMKSLGIQDSANLFFSQVFGSEQQCPDELKEVSYGIITKCGGLPLALINLSALLASQLDYSEIWYHMHDRLCSILNRSHTIEEIQKKILSLSYNSLPHCLKTCLLYFNMYPEGYIMWKVHLVKQWIAEGFINATEGKDTEEIAESYFDELVNRGMIQPMELGYSNEVLSCTVHHIILDLISHNSKEDEFLAAIDYSQTITGLSMKAHRLSFRFSSAKYAKQPAGITMPQLRSLGFFGVHKCMPSIVEFKHLRVLILDCRGDLDGDTSLNLSRICRLFQLRYLKISSDSMVELPTQMQGLRYLETMEIDARISSVPSDIVHLPSLLHLGLQDATKLPDGIGRMKSLNTLWYFDLKHNSEHNIWSLGKLTNLQHLHLTCSATLSGDQLKRKLAPLVSSLGKFSNLKSLTLTPDAIRSAIFFDVSSGISSPPMLLQRLELLPPICFFARLPTQIGEMHKLRILKIVVKELRGNDINNIALLPSLVILSLYVRTPPTGTIIFSNMAFPALKHFKFTCGVMCLAFQAGAMPNLQRLKLCFNAHRRESHYRVLNGIEHLLNLQGVAGQIGDPPGVDKSDRRVAKLSLEDTIRKHPRCLRFDIQFVDFIEEDYLPLDKLHSGEKEGSSGEHETTEKDCTKDTNKHADSRFSAVLDQPSASQPSCHLKSVSGVNIHKLQQVVKTRWLKPEEVLQILWNHELFTVSHKPPQKPPSGSWFLFNRRVLRYFRNDGFEWQKKNGKTINEAHEHLKVDNVDVLNCYYARGDKNPTFQRRIYWMLDPAYEHIVLVHYRDILEGSISVSSRNDSSTVMASATPSSTITSTSDQNGSASRAEVRSSPGWTSELVLPCSNSSSAEEVSSRTVTINNESNSRCGFVDWIQHKAALRKLKMQLSLEDKEDSYVIDEEVPTNNEHVIFPGIQTGEPDSSANFEDIFNVTDPCPSAIDVLKNSDTWLEEDQLEAILHPASMAPTEKQWFNIHEVSPESAFSSEITKVIVLGDFICNPSHSSLEMLFGDVKVPVEIIQQGAIRCHTPCLNAGKVTMCLIDGNGKPCSDAREFEFHEKPTKSMIDGNEKACNEAQDIKVHKTPTKSNDELLLLLKYVQILFDGHGCDIFSNFSPQLPNPGCGLLVNQMDIMRKTYEHLDPEKTVNSVMEVLLNDKFKQWISSKCEQNSDGDHLLPKQYHSVIHTIAALGYDLALKPLLSSGVPINYRDANGWTALHWAARFGREDMVVALLTAGAAAGALSHPTSEDPAAKTPASIALAFGFKGLSAFLSEAQLTTHLDSIESKENGKCEGKASGAGIRSAVDRISDKSTHVRGGTNDQLALKDSLGAVRNAVQAAARIQAAYRVFSFKKKKETALQNSCLSVHETVAVSHGMLEKAALSIQKNFRCWKKRKEFLKLRKNVIKIQARVRAHQERKKYKELIRSVGVLEKVMLRWYRKGVGLRGFNSGAMPVDEEVEEDVAKVFRKLRVETAIDEAVSRVSCIIGSPKAMQQYRRMLQRYQQAKVNIAKDASEVPTSEG